MCLTSTLLTAAALLMSSPEAIVTESMLVDHTVPHVAIEVGLTPEALVIADLSAQAAAAMLSRLDAATSERGDLIAAHAAVTQAVQQVGALKAAVRLNPGDETLLTQLAAAQSALASARTDLEEAQDALFDIATDGFSGQVVQWLNASRDSLLRPLPAAYRATVRSEADWIHIARALRIEAACTRLEEDVPDEVESLLADVRSEPAVQWAAQRLTTNLGSMQTAFHTWE